MKQKRFCPRCESVNVRLELNVLLALGMPQKWQCVDCGFEAFDFPIMEKLEAKHEN